MTEQFDPYRKWLGIPEQDQPPHHYRLLGIEPFESDPEVICNAVDARMAHIKTFQAGKHSDHSQRLLNELAAAKICLLNPEKKAEYDRKLAEARAARDAEREENAPEPRSEGSGPDELADLTPIGISPRPSAYIVRGRKKRQPAWLVPAIVFGVAALLALVLAIAFRDSLTDRGGSKQSGVSRKASAPVSAEFQGEAEVKPPHPQPAKPVVPPSKPEQPRKEPPITPEKPDVGELPPPQPPETVEQPEPIEPKEPLPEQPARKPPAIRKKLPVPDAAAQHEAEMEIRKRFAQEFAAADTVKGKIELAAKLRAQARATKDDPTARFVLDLLAGKLAARAGKLSLGFTAIDRIAEKFDVNPWAMKADLAEAAFSVHRIGGDDADSIARMWMHTETLTELADKAAAGDDLTTAVRAAKLAVATAKMTKDPSLLRDTSALVRELEHLKPRFRPVEAALAVLAENPDDAEANLTVGRWRCLAIGDWRGGLPLLAKGSDAALAGLARRDLEQPTTGKDRLALADAWYAAAEKEQPPAKSGLLARACYWYEQVQPALSGADKVRVDKRLDELHQKGIRWKPIRGVVVKGNVALAKRGATADGPSTPEKMLDGDSTTHEKDCAAYGKWPCRWIITLDKVYQLREIRFKLHDYDRKRAFRYILSVSFDGEHYTVVKDASRGAWRGWQQIFFSPRPVKTIRLEGLYCNTKPNFAVIEFEAYCIPPMETERGRALRQ